MITDKEIADLIDAHSSSGMLEDLCVFSFARSIERISRQHQRESDAALCDEVVKFFDGSAELHPLHKREMETAKRLSEDIRNNKED